MAVPVSDAELVRRRRAVFTGLRPYFPEHLLMQAVTCWQENYVNKPMFALNKFLFEICDAPALVEQRGDIHRSLMEALWADESTLEPDPFLCVLTNAQTLVSEQSSSLQGGQRSPPTQLFDSLVSEFLNRLSNEKKDADVKVRNALATSLAVDADVPAQFA